MFLTAALLLLVFKFCFIVIIVFLVLWLSPLRMTCYHRNVGISLYHSVNQSSGAEGKFSTRLDAELRHLSGASVNLIGFHSYYHLYLLVCLCWHLAFIVAIHLCYYCVSFLPGTSGSPPTWHSGARRQNEEWGRLGGNSHSSSLYLQVSFFKLVPSPPHSGFLWRNRESSFGSFANAEEMHIPRIRIDMIKQTVLPLSHLV